MDSARHGRAHVGHPLQRYWLRLLSVWKKSKIIRAPHPGIALCIVPYFIANMYVVAMIGVILVAIPYFIRI